MAKKKGRRKAKRSGQGSICISTTKPGPKGLAFQVTCYKSQAAADKAFMTRKKGSYNAMMFRRKGSKVG